MERRTLPDDEASRAALKTAEAELVKFNKFLVSMGYPPVSFLERPALITYIRVRELGLLDG